MILAGQFPLRVILWFLSVSHSEFGVYIMQKTFSATAQKSARLYSFCHIVQNGSVEDIREGMQSLIADPLFQSIGWQSNFLKLFRVFESANPEFSIFALGGNSKLPFVAFSTLPGVTCPGAGDCLNFCYSFRAWRYPAAFARQAQNAFLLRFHTATIGRAFDAIPGQFDFRLYVDGDFSTSSDLEFWFSILRARPEIRAYGYSKSFQLFLDFADKGGIFPSNYLLNISSGHNAGADIVEKIKALPITRGEFRAVSIGRKVKSSDHGTVENNAALRAVSAEKIFPCPGKCGTCTGAGHACGLPQLKGRIIAIAIH